MITEVSPNTASVVQPIVKLPMILMLICCGFTVGLNSCAVVFLGELLTSHTILDAPGLLIILCSFSATAAAITLFGTNFVFSLYDQIDAAPVYITLCMVFNIVCGLLLLGEGERYATANLFGISLGVIICICGVLVLGKKRTMLGAVKKKEEQAPEEELV